VDIDELLRYAGMEPYQVTDESHLFSQKQVNLFHDKIVELTGSRNISREAGRFAASPEALGSMQGSVIGLLGPMRYYELIGKFANKISKASHYEARRMGGCIAGIPSLEARSSLRRDFLLIMDSIQILIDLPWMR
jgi:hypothetical protein